jgi:hypothetical protein
VFRIGLKSDATLALAAVLALSQTGCATRQPPEDTGNALVGTWKLISIERRTADGAVVPGVNPVGGLNPSGTVIYTADGHVSLQIMPSGRSREVDILRPLTPEQAKETLFGYIAYFGTFTLDTREHIMHIHFDGSLNPSMVGTDGTRSYEVSGDRMTLRAGAANAVSTYLMWERPG